MMPWDDLVSDGWRIVGMNHYDLGGKRYLFCSMARDGRCITAEGTNEHQVFDDLAEKTSAEGAIEADVNGEE